MKRHNFNAGPCVLPKEAIESAIEAIRDFDNTGIGILEISHRTPGWERIMAETEQLWRDLLNIPDDYAVIFLGGGALDPVLRGSGQLPEEEQRPLTSRPAFGPRKLPRRPSSTARWRS